MDENFNLDLDFFMSGIEHIETIKENQKTRIDRIFYSVTNSTCILRVCKERDLTEVYKVLKETKHPNLTVVYDYIYANGNTYVIEEYINGETLDERLEEDKLFSETETAEIIMSVCDALSVLHNMKPPVVHNDIKPANIIICDDGNVKIFDFDVSRTVKEDKDKNTTLFGTEEFASPEHRGCAQTTPRSDIYSLGLTMHYMLTNQGLRKNDRKPVHRGRLRRVIKKATAFDPKKRYHSCSALKKALAKYFTFKKRLLIIFILLLCLVGAVLLTANLLRGNSETEQKKATDAPTSATQTTTQTPIISSSSYVEEATEKVTFRATTEVVTTQPVTTPSTSKRVTKPLTIEGKISSLHALNNGTFVFLEETSSYNYTIRNSLGKSASVQFNDPIELIYNQYTDELYLSVVHRVGSNNEIYHIDKELNISSAPVYTAPGSSSSSSASMFITEDTLLCPTFTEELIDAKSWTTFANANIHPKATLNGKLYRLYHGINFTTVIEEINTNGDTLSENNLDYSYEICAYNKGGIYILASKNSKQYVLKFDGSNITEIACLNDYNLYTNIAQPYVLAVTEKSIWVSDGTSLLEFSLN